MVRPTLAHEPFITRAVAKKAEQKLAECIRPPLCLPGQILHRLLQGAQKADCILGRGVCVGGPPARFLCRVWQSQARFAISPSHVRATNLQLTYCSDSRAYLFILRGIFIVMGELYCNSAVFCYFELVLARESNPSRICLLQRFKSQSLILAPVPRKKSYK